MVLGSLGSSANQVLIKIKGDDKDFQNTLKKSDSSMAGFASKMKTYGPMIGAAFGAAAVGFVAMSVKMSAAEEAVSRQTEALLKSQGVMWSAVGGEFDAYMKQLEELTAYNDTDLQVAFNSMIAAGMSYTEAMDNMNTVTSMAFSLNRDLASMAQLLGKAYNGQTGELSRYGIVLGDNIKKGEEVAAIQAHVAENFADASDRAESYEGQMELLTSEMSNFAEAVGAELLPTLTDIVSGMNELGGAEASGIGTTIGKAINEGLKLTLSPDLILASKLANIRMESVIGSSDQAWRQNLVDQAYTALALEDAAAITLSEKLRIEKEILAAKQAETAELEKQITLEQMAASINLGIQARGGFGGASMSAATAKDLSVSDANINPNITSSVRSGV